MSFASRVKFLRRLSPDSTLGCIIISHQAGEQPQTHSGRRHRQLLPCVGKKKMKMKKKKKIGGNRKSSYGVGGASKAGG